MKKETSPRRQSDGLCIANGQESSRWVVMIITYGCVDNTIMTEPMTKPNNLFVVVSIVPSFFLIRKIWLVNDQQIFHLNPILTRHKLHFTFSFILAEGSGPTRLPLHVSSPRTLLAAGSSSTPTRAHQVKGEFRDTAHPVELAEFSAIVIVRRAGLLLSQQDFEWRWSVPLFQCLTVLEFSLILFDLCLLITLFNFIMNYVPIVTFWIFTYHKIWILSITFCFIWSYWIIYFLACL